MVLANNCMYDPFYLIHNLCFNLVFISATGPGEDQTPRRTPGPGEDQIPRRTPDGNFMINFKYCIVCSFNIDKLT